MRQRRPGKRSAEIRSASQNDADSGKAAATDTGCKGRATPPQQPDDSAIEETDLQQPRSARRCRHYSMSTQCRPTIWPRSETLQAIRRALQAHQATRLPPNQVESSIPFGVQELPAD